MLSLLVTIICLQEARHQNIEPKQQSLKEVEQKQEIEIEQRESEGKSHSKSIHEKVSLPKQQIKAEIWQHKSKASKRQIVLSGQTVHPNSIHYKTKSLQN